MFLLEKSVIGTYYNRLYDLKERQDPFHAKAELKQIAQEKILVPQILVQKGTVTKSFRCCSHKCLYGEAGAAALIDTFEIGSGDNVPCRGKIALYLGEKCFLFCFVIAL